MPNPPLDVTPLEIAGQQTIGGAVFPLILQCGKTNVTLEETVQWTRSRQAEFQTQVAEHGAILFRGFPLHSADDFDAFVSAFDLPNFPYDKSLSNAVRVNWTERVFSANEAPSNVTIYFHHEMAQTPIFPARLFFFCEQPADEGGETPICRSDALLQRLQERCPEFVRNCEEKGLQYTNVMPAENDAESGMGRSWQSTLGVSTQNEAEQRLKCLNYSWEWLADGCLKATTPVLPAVREISPGRKSFFNQLIAAFQGWKDDRNDPEKAIRFGDGTSLDREAVNIATELAEEVAFDIPWQTGDVALIDNCLAMHGRRTFQGKRKVLASLASAESHAFSENDREPSKDGEGVSGPHWERATARQTTVS